MTNLLLDHSLRMKRNTLYMFIFSCLPKYMHIYIYNYIYIYYNYVCGPHSLRNYEKSARPAHARASPPPHAPRHVTQTSCIPRFNSGLLLYYIKPTTGKNKLRHICVRVFVYLFICSYFRAYQYTYIYIYTGVL